MRFLSFLTSLLVGCVVLSLVVANEDDDVNYIELDLVDMVQNPPPVEINATVVCEQSVWCQFRPNLNKLILSGAADTEHISILWYPITNGSVGLHYHGKTESVYTVNGTQADNKGVYPTGSVYFNPPGSGHSVWDSSGFFLLSYAAPPDFGSTDLISYDYTPVIIDTAQETGNMTQVTTLVADNGHTEYRVPLDETGGMSAVFIEGLETPHTYQGNFVLVLQGPCMVNGKEYGEQMLIVAKGIPTISFELQGSDCKVHGIAFTTSAPTTTEAPSATSVDDVDAGISHGATILITTLSMMLVMTLL